MNRAMSRVPQICIDDDTDRLFQCRYRALELEQCFSVDNLCRRELPRLVSVHSFGKKNFDVLQSSLARELLFSFS